MLDGADDTDSDEEEHEDNEGRRRKRSRREKIAEKEAKKTKLRGDIQKAAGTELLGTV